MSHQAIGGQPADVPPAGCDGRVFAAGELVALGAADWLWETDREHRFTWVSDGLAQATGLDPAEFLGRARLELMLKAAGASGARQLDDLRRVRPFRDFIHEMRGGGNGHRRRVSISGLPLFDADGAFRGYRGTGRDVTAVSTGPERPQDLDAAKRGAGDVLHDLERTLETMDLGVVLLDRDLNALVVNKAFYDIWKVGRDAVGPGLPFRALMDINRHNGIYDVADSEWEDYVARRLNEIRDGDVSPREFHRADGCTMIYSVTSLMDGRRLVTYYDITSIKEREAQLEQALEQAKLSESVINSISHPMFVKDAGLRFVMVNEAFSSFFDAEPAEMIGRTAGDFLDEASTAEFEASERFVLETGRLYEVEEEEEADPSGVGSSRIVRKNRVRTESGRDYVACSIFDVTELKRQRNEAERSRAYLANVLDSLPAAVILYDSDDRFVLANRRLQDMLPGLEPAWEPGCTFRRAMEIGRDLGYFRSSGDAEVDALYDADKEAWLEAYMEQHRKPYHAYERAHSDGRWFQVYDAHMPDGSFIGIRVEITDIKQREAELQEARQKAVLADRAKTEFLANMSHEIRTPMNGVLGMAELLAKSELDSKQRTFVDIIGKSGNALLTIINDILDFSKIDAGQLVLDPAPFRLAEAIEDVATLVSTRAKEKDLELIVRVQPRLHDSYVGDVGRFRQIITNLMGNAVKFTDSGHVLVDVTGEAAGEGTRLLVRVIDTGIGIPADKVGLVFDKFSQVDASSTRRHEGTGLGLAITSRLVQMMGGEIGVESVEGEGSTFWFTVELPRAEGSGRGKVMPIDVTGARILIVDDNEINRSILLEQARAWGFDACAAVDGPEGIAVLEAVAAMGAEVDCMILDYQMPGMTGAEVARVVRETPEIAATPIVMLTSVDQSLSQSGYRSCEIDAHLIKPARSSALLEALVGAIQKHRGGPGAVPERKAEPQRAAADAAGAEIVEKRFPQRRPAGNAHRVDILVAEDNEVNQLVFTQILGETGLSFELVGNGQAAVEAQRQMNPRLILMDVSMPEMNGLEATQQIRRREETVGGHVPIIGVTAHALKGDREKCLEAGMDDYLSKPISPRALVEKLDRWIAETETQGAQAG